MGSALARIALTCESMLAKASISSARARVPFKVSSVIVGVPFMSSSVRGVSSRVTSANMAANASGVGAIAEVVWE